MVLLLGEPFSKWTSKRPVTGCNCNRRPGNQMPTVVPSVYFLPAVFVELHFNESNLSRFWYEVKTVGSEWVLLNLTSQQKSNQMSSKRKQFLPDVFVKIHFNESNLSSFWYEVKTVGSDWVLWTFSSQRKASQIVK